MTASEIVGDLSIPSGYVEQLLRSIGMFEQVAHKPKLSDRSMDLFSSRELEFDWVHMGNSEVRIGSLVDTLRQCPFLYPPRTGHIGNWANMVHGRAGARDYNHIAFGPKRLGYPLVFDFNQTEAEACGYGDWSYLPGSLVDRAEREILPLFTWDGTGFCPRDRGRPLFTPFTLTSRDGQLLPLTRLHRDALRKLAEFHFESTLFASHDRLVRRILRVLLEDARVQGRPESMLGRILDRCVTLDGDVTRCALRVSGRGFEMNSVHYSGVEEVIDHAWLPISMAAQPERLLEQIGDLPAQMPLLANSLVQLLKSVLYSHYPTIGEVPRELSRPCNPHLHWGGIPMAGYPPRARGYFSSLTKYLRKLFRPVIRELPEVAPVFNVLLPAAVFNLCPQRSLPGDVDCLARLMSRVRDETTTLIGRPEIMRQRIEQIVEDWRPKAEKTLSDYMIDHFAPRPGVASSLPEPVEGEPVMLESFCDLTVQQASMLMGALSAAQWPRNSQRGVVLSASSLSCL